MRGVLPMIGSPAGLPRCSRDGPGSRRRLLSRASPINRANAAAPPRRQCSGDSLLCRSSSSRGSALSRNSSSSPRTPHSGYHYDGRTTRFFEGWYFKVYIPEVDESFALIYSIEDPKGSSCSGMGAQIMGPGDGYLLQYSKDTSTFWASPSSLELGGSFTCSNGATPQGPLSEADWNGRVDQGFQVAAKLHQGSLVASEAGAPGNLPSTVSSAKWSFTVEPRSGWGSDGAEQQSTAGWLAALPVFEPHWQILMAHGEATGWIEWGGRRYEFQGAPSYSEKNWGGGFPKVWFWAQCNTFEGHPGTSVTAVGARRGIPLIPGLEEDVGMIGIHHEGEFYELMPQTSEVQWIVEPWGSWRVWAMTSGHEVMLEASTEAPGTPLRAPTATEGLAPFCRDTFRGRLRLRVWERDSAGVRRGTPMLDATSNSAALEVGGGPWWSTWRSKAKMAPPIRALVQLPIESAINAIPGPIRPPGL